MSQYADDDLGVVDAEGWLSSARRVESPNHDDRPEGEAISLAVIHAISLPPGCFEGRAVERFFTNSLAVAEHPFFETIAGLRVSAHFFIRRSGELIQFVSCLRRAWHAGVSCWEGRVRCNDFSIGIELEGCDDQAFSANQYAKLNGLMTVLCQSYPIDMVVGHSDIAPGRKTDPGPCFDWRRLAPSLPIQRNSMS